MLKEIEWMLVRLISKVLMVAAVAITMIGACAMDSPTWEGLKIAAAMMLIGIGYIYVYIRVFWEGEEEDDWM